MFESLLTISIVGMVVGFIFSVPVAGPISILITSHALKGEGRYCIRVALGAAIADFSYCFIAVFGFTHLYLRYETIIPYILMAGSLFIIYLGVHIMRMRLDLDHLDDTGSVSQRVERLGKKGGFRTGLVLNFLNPSLFIGWTTSSFIIMSLVASLGFNVGNLNNVLSNNVDTINSHTLHIGTDSTNSTPDIPSHLPVPLKANPVKTEPFTLFQIMNSLAYAFFVGFGVVIWFYYFSGFLVRNRQKLNINILNRIIQLLGVVLCCFGLYLIYIATQAFLGQVATPHPPM